MKKNKSALDEMQDQKLLKMEEYGFWILFWALAASIPVQLLAGGSFREIVGEMIVLFLGSVYIAASSLKQGLWTRTSTPTRRGNAAASVIPSLLLGVLHVIRLLTRGKEVDTASLRVTAGVMAAVYLACFVLLEVFRVIYQKRRAALDHTDDENDG